MNSSHGDLCCGFFQSDFFIPVFTGMYASVFCRKAHCGEKYDIVGFQSAVLRMGRTGLYYINGVEYSAELFLRNGYRKQQ